MNFRIIKGPDNCKNILRLKMSAELSKRGTRQALYRIGKDLRGTAKDSILAKPRYGRVYKISRNGQVRRHVASRPGEAPASFSGTLWRSLDFKVSGADQLEFGYRSSAAREISKTVKGVFYGKYLELGTSKMKPRPGLKLSLKQNERNAVSHFETQLKKELKQ